VSQGREAWPQQQWRRRPGAEKKKIDAKITTWSRQGMETKIDSIEDENLPMADCPRQQANEQNPHFLKKNGQIMLHLQLETRLSS
jgi:hypothetical protein